MIVVGACIAEHVCTIELEHAGRPLLVQERKPQPKGYVRTELVDGFFVDCGLQALFAAYPVINRYLDLDALDAHRFASAARSALPADTSLIGDAIRTPSLLPAEAAHRPDRHR
ncbi:MAG: hypothetical protein HYX65_02155 [Gemmatimonadetes bacterium]|nr:hypothetical protein [Gemmatimonadota bacterium]